MSKKKKKKRKLRYRSINKRPLVPAVSPRITGKARNAIVPASAPPDRQRNVIVAVRSDRRGSDC